MAKIKNMGTSTAKFNEGIIVTGSAGTDVFSLVITGSTRVSDDLIVGGESQSAGSDNNFFVSGSINSKDTATRGTAVFGGDVVVSGSLLDSKGGKYLTTSKHYAIGHNDLTTGTKPVNWINAASVSAANAIKTWFIVPFPALIDSIIVTVKGNNFDNANDGNITLNVYKNQQNFNGTIYTQTNPANDFVQVVSNMAGGTTDCNQRTFVGIDQSVAAGDLIQIKIGKTSGSDREAIVTLVFDG